MKISLISPVYNEERFLQDMIASLQRQSHEDWELVLVDDGSVDRTAEIIADATAKDSRIKLAAGGKKFGKIQAFNIAFAASSGDLVAMMGGDDIVPEGALERRIAAFEGLPANDPAIAFFKLRTFSDDPRYHGMTLPRGQAVSRSGGSSTLNRALANLVLPINETLVAEDIWLAYGGMGHAVHVIERQDIVLDYRIHAGNSTPRFKPFDEMSEAVHVRHRAFHLLLNQDRFELNEKIRIDLTKMWQAEGLRYAGKTTRLLTSSSLPVADRLAMASMSNPKLHKIRSKFPRFFTGRRGK